MNRNGLLTLIAVLMALALAVRMENAAQAQITYYDWLTGIGMETFNVGNRVEIGRDGASGNTWIIFPDYSSDLPPEYIYGRQTNNQGGTVFANNGYDFLFFGEPAFIDAGSGSVISTTEPGPAISNGFNNQSITDVPRTFIVRITRLPGSGQYQLEYLVQDSLPPNTIAPYPPDLLPDDLTDHDNLTFGGVLPGHVALLDPDLVLFDMATGLPLAPDDYTALPLSFIIRRPVMVDGVTDYLDYDEDDEPLPTIPGPGLPLPRPNISGDYMLGTLFINQNSPRHQGDARTLIQAGTVAIENYGTLTVNHAKIQAGSYDLTGTWIPGTAGIVHEYVRMITYTYNDDGVIIGTTRNPLIDFSDLILNNTQIGTPRQIGGTYESTTLTGYDIIVDPITGELILVPIYETATIVLPDIESVIDVDQWGKPIQTTTALQGGRDTIDNGRILVAQDVTMHRNPIGLIYQHEGEHYLTGAPGFAEMQETRYDIFTMIGPNIGIYTYLFGIDDLLGDRIEDVYTSGRILGTGTYYTSEALSMPDTSRVLNLIELNDNSWIFANTGISYGGEGIGMFIDSTSGIYARDLGITDRWSLRELYAVDRRPTPIIAYPLVYGAYDPLLYGYDLLAIQPTDLFGGYSGSFHEIRVDGKLIAGVPSRAGIQFSFDYEFLSPDDRNRLRNVYYHDPYDIDADEFGNVYYYNPNAENSTHNDYDPERNARVAAKFIAYNNQPNRIFWLRNGNNSIQLTYYDYASQRWMVNPASGTPGAWLPNSSTYSNLPGLPYFTPFDASHGIGIEVIGTSMAWEGEVFPAPNWDPWSVYYGPTVRQITALGDDALIAGGNFQNYQAAIFIGDLAHVSKIVVGENRDVRNLSDALYFGAAGSHSVTPTLDIQQSAKNFRAFDTMTSINRSKLLYNPDVLYSDDPNVFHFDNSGIQGDIVTFYNAIATVMTGGDGFTWDASGNWIGEGEYSPSIVWNVFWSHGHPGTPYYTEALDLDETTAPSFLLGHRDGSVTDVFTYSSAIDIPGRSLVLDEILLNYLANQTARFNGPGVMTDSYGYADNPRHFREALSRYLHYNTLFVELDTGLYISELLEGYTRDGTLLVFTGGDIFSGNIFGGGIGDPFGSERYFNDWTYFEVDDDGTIITSSNSQSSYLSSFGFGNVDLRFRDGTTIFNRNVAEWADGTRVFRDAGIRVRDVYVEKTGHLLLNDAVFTVNPFSNPLVAGLFSDESNDRIIIHDVLNEGIISGNGTFLIAQRYSQLLRGDYFEGYLINRGVLAPGLPGFIGENEHQAIDIEKTVYDDMMSNFTDSAKSIDWDMQGVPGGQFGTITVFGSLRLMDEHTRPVIYDPNHSYDTYNGPTWNGPLYNTLETLAAGEYHVTVGNDSIGDVFGKYAVTINNATPTLVPHPNGTGTYVYDTSGLQPGEISKEDWEVIAAEKLRTQLSWFSPSAMVSSETGLPLLTDYEQFEYLTSETRRAELQRQMIVAVLTPDELREYDTNPVRRAILNRQLLTENNIRFELTQLDALLMHFGFSDVVSVHGTVPPYIYNSYHWGSTLYDLGSPSSPPSNAASSAVISQLFLGITQLGGIIQADRIYDLDDNADSKEKQTSFIIIASEGYTVDGSIKQVTSATTDWVFANVSVMPIQMPSGQFAAVLTVIDDPNYYRNRVRKGGDSYNAQSVASALDDAMFTNPGLAQSFNFGLNSPGTLNNVFRQVAGATRANSLSMNMLSPWDHLFNRIGYGVGGLITGGRGDIVFRNVQTGQLQQPYGQPAVPPPGHQFAPPMGGQTRGQSPSYRTGSVWGAYTHSNFAMADNGNSFKYTYYRNGAMVGSEWNLTPSSVIGGVAMFSDGELTSLNDKVKSQDYTFGLYFVAAPFEQFEVKSFLGTGYQSYKSDRYIRSHDVFIGNTPGGVMSGVSGIFGIDDHYDSETHGYSFNYALEFARPFTVNPNFVIRPAAGLEYRNVYQKGYFERLHESSGATWINSSNNIAEGYEAEGAASGTYAMNYNDINYSQFLIRAGFNTESYFARGGVQLRAYHVFRLAGDRFPTSRQSFVSGSREFDVRGGEFGYNQWQLGAGTHFWLNQDRTATLFFDGDWNFSPFKAGYSKLGLTIGSQVSF